MLLPSGCAGGLGPAEQQAFVDAHNEARARVEPAPETPLPPLSWSDEAAAVASAWASGCTLQHNEDNGDRGENIAFFSTTTNSHPEMVVDEWAAERILYDYESSTCSPGQQCGHYTQVVWRETDRVGCGVAACRILGTDGLLWVCNYEPAGNVVGQRPY